MSGIENIVIQSSKEGIDSHGMDHEMLLNRTMDVKSDNAPFAVEYIYHVKNYAMLMEPRLRPYTIQDAKTFRYEMASHQSVNGRLMRMFQTTRQEHSIQQNTLQNRTKLQEMLQGKQQNQFGG